MRFLNTSKESVNYVPVTVAYGDGIGPEIMEVTLNVLRHAEARIKIETVEVGEAFYKKGYSSGIPDYSWEIIKRNKVFLKAPITTPQGSGYKSLNVTLRKALSLYANIRPCVAYAPFIPTKFSFIDVVVVRENEEDLYAGIEYRQSQDAYHDIKLITRSGCEKIVRYAFEYARKNNRKKITCLTKDNIMKMTDGLFHKVFDEISPEYPEIIKEHYILDIGTARLATVPENFDVVVTLNLYGDVISDVVAEMTGSVGLGGSSNIGREYSMFEAIHGSAPTMVGQNRANPTALLMAAVEMLNHIGQCSTAALIKNSILYNIEQGNHTPDVAKNNCHTKNILGTKEFGEAIIKSLGKIPEILPAAIVNDDFEFDGYANPDNATFLVSISNQEKKQLCGVDIFIDKLTNGLIMGNTIVTAIKDKGLKLGLSAVSYKGLQCYPNEGAEQFHGDSWCCRFLSNKTGDSIEQTDILALLQELILANIDVVKTENLYNFNDIKGFSLHQGS